MLVAVQATLHPLLCSIRYVAFIVRVHGIILVVPALSDADMTPFAAAQVLGSLLALRSEGRDESFGGARSESYPSLRIPMLRPAPEPRGRMQLGSHW